jgi:hypothetical protein
VARAAQVRGPVSITLLGITTLAVLGCAGTRIDEGVFSSSKGYRVTIPGADWTVTDARGADLALTHKDQRAAMLVNASCGRDRSNAPLAVLARHLLTGVRDRSVIAREEVSVNGSVARHSIVEARTADTGEPVTIELYVMRDERCLYDFLYVAPPETFETRRSDFDRLVRTFTAGGSPSARPSGAK